MLQNTIFFWKYKNMKKTSFFLQFLPTKNGIFWTKKTRFFFAPKLFTFCSKNNGFFFVRFTSIKWHFLSKKKHFFYRFLAYILEQFGAKISIKIWNTFKKKKIISDNQTLKLKFELEGFFVKISVQKISKNAHFYPFFTLYFLKYAIFLDIFRYFY